VWKKYTSEVCILDCQPMKGARAPRRCEGSNTRKRIWRLAYGDMNHQRTSVGKTMEP
jgi:hypothetical protein